jgi:putative SOS response-associated peptidase YedK
MKTGESFGIGGIWENWKEPRSSEWIRTFAVITTDANELVGEIHDRIPLILAPKDYLRWLGEEPDPRDLMKPFPSEPMRMLVCVSKTGLLLSGKHPARCNRHRRQDSSNPRLCQSDPRFVCMMP